MTAWPDAHGRDFDLVCDGCSQTVRHLANSMHNWDLAWMLLRQHGWRGARLATGPHACPRCARTRVSWLATDKPAVVGPAGNRRDLCDLRRYGVIVKGFGRKPQPCAEPPANLVLDCARARLLDCEALATLVAVRHLVAQRGGSVYLLDPPPAALRALRRLCLASLFVIVPARSASAAVDIRYASS